ncbi:MAG TPA: nucleotide pyrophosphohydrolase [Tepidisphaeraceae bacterium]|jgi:dCTP diphosphatase|nr:nucleotide pyrophosphohydrolase [Tepidisphaeraceae bacterium]
MNPDDLNSLTQLVLRHRDDRQWAQFHTPKELAISLCVESAELLGLMQWKNGEQLTQTLARKHEQVSDELADVFHSLLLLAADFQVQLGQSLLEKLAKDAKKYPVEKSRGKNLKYDEL